MPDNVHLPITDDGLFGGYLNKQNPKLVIVGSTDERDGGIDYLSQQPYELKAVNTLNDLKEILSADSYDIVFLNANIVDIESLELIQMLASMPSSFHLIVRSETNEEVDRVIALELGADDCVSLSCGPREIKARVRALLRRRLSDANRFLKLSAEQGSERGSELSYQDWTLNRGNCQLYSPEGEAISLTNAEYQILNGLFGEPGKIKDRSSLISTYSEDSENEVRSLDVFVSRLRKKMAQHGGQHLIETVRGKGYRLTSLVPRTE